MMIACSVGVGVTIFRCIAKSTEVMGEGRRESRCSHGSQLFHARATLLELDVDITSIVRALTS